MQRIQLSVAALVALAFAFCMAHPQFRQLKCATPDGRGGSGRPAPEGDGCFTEEHNGEERVYCDLVCPKAHTVFNAHIDQGHRSCFNYYTYQLEKRNDDWFMWRSGKCLNSTATFTIGCKFDEPFRTQFPSDNDVFRALRARARKA
uniref:Secreted protein n=1 Tax=Ditylenchus dipsaci TaxID=166011 RepID=A0A915DBX3_9BILA